MILDQMAINGMASSSSPFFPPNFLLQIQSNSSSHHDDVQDQPHNPLASLLPSNPQDFRGPMMLGKRRSVSFSGMEEEEEREQELSDDCSQGGAGERKRRLSTEQVRTLERSFEMGNKLEPERKMQLARALGLQARQVAIWFQNRRARWKNKQLEKDYDLLKRQLQAVQSENEALQAHNKKLQAEISALRGRDTPELINLNKETEGSCSNRSENSSEINLDNSATQPNINNVDSPIDPHQGIPFFPAVQLLPGTTAACPIKAEHNGASADENFGNLLCGIDDQSAFWPWSDPHSFH